VTRRYCGEVATAEGQTRIDEIEPGDLVRCQDDVTRQTRLCMVSHVYKTENRAILDLTVARPDGREEVIGVTGNHRFWIEGEGWTEAAELMVGDDLVDQQGEPISVVAIQDRDAPAISTRTSSGSPASGCTTAAPPPARRRARGRSI
jgi:Pretoxin HINT domain